MAERKIVVGTDHGGYSNERNISGLPFQNVEIVRTNNLFRGPNYLYFKLRKKLNPYLGNLHYCTPWAPLDLVHLYHGIHLGSKPWFSTFETFLPRWAAYGKGNVEWGLKQIAKPQCKGIFAISECAAHIQKDILKQHPQFEEVILPKISVLQPPQPLLIDSFEEKKAPGEVIKLAFAGADFFRKGGLQMLRAFEVAIQQGAPLHLTIISSLNTGDYASHAGLKELHEARLIIAAYPEAITHHSSLPNAKTLQIFRDSDVGLLPTWADTFGFSVLEAQAAGCPVITTDIRALPEMNDDRCGWMIPVPKDNWRNAVLATENDRQAASETIEKGLIAIFTDIAHSPAQIIRKGKTAWERIRDERNPNVNAQVLEAAYKNVLGK